MTSRSLLLKFLVSVLLSSPSVAFTEDIDGKISTVDGQTITISSTSGLLPIVGDKLSVFVEIPGVGRASVGSGAIIRVEDGAIVAKIEKATGKVSIGQLVVITSPKPQKHPAARAPILLGRSGKDAKKVIEDAGFVAKVEIGVDAPARVQPFSVYAQDPAPGSALAAGDSIIITLYGGEVSNPSPLNPIDSPEPDAANYKVGDRIVAIRSFALTGAGASQAKIIPGFIGVIEDINNNLLRVTHIRTGWLDKANVIPFGPSAVGRLSRLITASPDNASLYRARGLVHKDLRQYEKALEDLDKAVSLQPISATLNDRGRVHWANGMPDKAIADYTEALKLRSSLVTYNNRALVWLDKQEYDKAIADYERALQIDPKFVFAHAGMGIAGLKKGDYETALVEFNETKRLAPKFSRAYGYLARLRSTCPDPHYRDAEVAVELATKACELSDWKDWSCLGALAGAYAEAGKFENAIQWQTRAIEVVQASAREEYEQRLEFYRAGKPYREIPFGKIDSPGNPTRPDHFEDWGRLIDPDGDSTVRAQNGKLTITVNGGLHDLWPSRAEHQRFNAPRVLQEVDGDFVMQVKLTANWKPYTDDTNVGAGLFVWHSDKDFLRCERHVYILEGAPRCYTGPMCYAKNEWISGKTKTNPEVYYKGPTTWLRVERSGSTMICSISHDGTNWIVTERLNADYPDRLQVGVHAVKISPGTFTAEFEEFQLKK